MKKYLLILLLFSSLKPYAQYTSSEEREYMNKQKKYFPPFQPIDKERVLAFTSFGIHIRETGAYVPYKGIYDWSPLQSKLLDEKEPTGIKGISENNIIKQEENERIRAVLYKDYKYDDLYTEGIWIAICNKKEHTCKKYYTGLSMNQPLHFKWDSGYPLLKNDSTLQLEAALIRQITSWSQLNGPTFDLVKDGLVVEFEMAKITLDSDGDGLTDIVENKMLLDPYDPDTDHDGIPDNIDASPRPNSNRTDKTIIFESMLAGNELALKDPDHPDIKVPLAFLSDSLFNSSGINKKIADSVNTLLLISDSPDILGIKNSNRRLIIITPEEYLLYKEKYWSPLPRYYMSHLFKVDGLPDSYILRITYEGGYAGESFLIQKFNDRWIVSSTSIWIA